MNQPKIPRLVTTSKKSSDDKQKTTDGYKAHLNVEEDGFISKAITTAGFVHDS